MHAIAEQGIPQSAPEEVERWVEEVRTRLLSHTIAPYLGAGVFPSGGDFPASYEALAEYFGRKVALPRRARGNFWASAQYVESRKHRITAERMMNDVFGGKRKPDDFHRWLAGLSLPLIVDNWYDGTMRAALAATNTPFVEVQAGTRSKIGEHRFYHTYDKDGQEVEENSAAETPTVLYTPHGSATPVGDYLMSDADYVEVLTEIDIQSPIPKLVQARRAVLGFVFLGCRFHDQTLRIYARQIAKRSAGPHFALVDPEAPLHRNELRFLESIGARTVVAPTADVLSALAAQ